MSGATQRRLERLEAQVMRPCQVCAVWPRFRPRYVELYGRAGFDEPPESDSFISLSRCPSCGRMERHAAESAEEAANYQRIFDAVASGTCCLPEIAALEAQLVASAERRDRERFGVLYEELSSLSDELLAALERATIEAGELRPYACAVPGCGCDFPKITDNRNTA